MFGDATRISSATGNDIIEGGGGLDFLFWPEGNDESTAGGNDFGNDGDDELYGDDAADFRRRGTRQTHRRVRDMTAVTTTICHGQRGVDRCLAATATIGITADRKWTKGGDGDDIIFGEGDIVWRFGNDCIDGGDAGIDFCGDGNDRAWGRNDSTGYSATMATINRMGARQRLHQRRPPQRQPLRQWRSISRSMAHRKQAARRVVAT